MTVARGNIQRSVHEGEVGVHSLDHFVLTVPDLKTAERFYSDFGLDVRNVHNGIELRTFGSDQCWGRAVEGLRKQLHHISFGCFAEDLPYFQSEWRRMASRFSIRRSGSKATDCGAAIRPAC